MPSGGARARSGPQADPNSGRSESGRNAKDGWIDLPVKPKNTRPPTFPLEGKTSSEDALWKAIWKKPQAEQWRKQGLVWQVAAYVRTFLESTEKGAPASLKTAVLRMEDGLGLSTIGLIALRWRITQDEVAAKRSAPVAVVEPERPAPVRRLRATA